MEEVPDATRARAAAEPGSALTYAFNKMGGTAELCHQQGIAFIQVVAESMGGWHKVAMEQLKSSVLPWQDTLDERRARPSATWLPGLLSYSRRGSPLCC